MHNLEILAPTSGVFLPIENVPDPVFADKLLGDGFAIDPTDNKLKSPFAGKVVQLHKSNHAITIETSTGVQILLHIGIDTVTLKGEGFKPLVAVGDQVKAAQDLIEFDLDLIVKAGFSLITVIISLSPDSKLMLETKGPLLTAGNKIGSINSDHKEKQSAAQTEHNDSIKTEYIIKLPSGMHARPAAKLAELAKKFSAITLIKKEGQVAKLTSVVSVLSLGIEYNETIQLEASGMDAKNALHEVKLLLDQIAKEENSQTSHSITPKTDLNIALPKDALGGVCASNGIAIGNVVLISHEEIEFSEDAKDKEAEEARLLEALAQANIDLLAIEKELVSQNETSKSAIFAAHREILNDEELMQETLSLIGAWKTAEYAWDECITKRAIKLESLKNELIAARANDLRDVGRRVLLILTGKSEKENELVQDSIIIAHDLNPSDIIQFDKEKVIGFCTVCGGSTSHVAILARSIGIPAIAGIDEKALKLTSGQKVIMDANEGILYTNPTSEQIAKAKKEQDAYHQKLETALKTSKEITYSADNKRIKVVSNIGSVEEAKKATELGAEGVGLLRTEFIFLERKNAPSETEQIEIYQNIVNALAGNELVLRTLDIGGDKQLSYLPIKPEENPFLGVRGIRFCLRNEGIFREQLRAILQVSSEKPIHIMFPMVGHINELRGAKEILEEERVKLNAPVPKIGIMVEVPSAALMADVFAPEVDFFSVGTNDLTQYTLATDRGHSELAGQVDGLNPGVLKLISLTCQAAKKHGKWVGVCGGIASETKAIPVLLGLGVEELSLSMPSIPIIKSTVRNLDIKKCESLVEDFLSASSGKEVRQIVTHNWPEL